MLRTRTAFAAAMAGILAATAPVFANDRSTLTINTIVVADIGRDTDLFAHPRTSEARLLSAPPVEIPYPERSYYSSGQATIAIEMDSSGQISKATVARTSGFARIDANALVAVRSGRYQAATVDGQSIGGRYLVTVDLAADR